MANKCELNLNLNLNKKLSDYSNFRLIILTVGYLPGSIVFPHHLTALLEITEHKKLTNLAVSVILFGE